MKPRRGFTLIELLMAISIMGIMMVISFFTFNTVTRNWTKSMELVDRMQHAEYALTQVISGLRSAYFPMGAQDSDMSRGFQLYDDGDDEKAKDSIQWTKLGTAIVGNTSKLSETPHIVQMWVEDGSDKERPAGLWVKACHDLLPKNTEEEIDFGDDEQFEPFLLVQGVIGFNCRVADKEQPFNDDGSWNWQDEWSTSNCLPRAVELTFYLEPVEERGLPETVMRVVEIPLAKMSQNPVKSDSSGSGDGTGKKNGGKGSSGEKGGATGGTPGGGARGGGAGSGGGAGPGGGMRGGGGPGGGAGPGGGMRGGGGAPPPSR